MPALGPRLLYPTAFAGAGDMRRGSLLLTAARSGRELDYSRPATAWRSGRGRAAGRARPRWAWCGPRGLAPLAARCYRRREPRRGAGPA